VPYPLGMVTAVLAMAASFAAVLSASPAVAQAPVASPSPQAALVRIVETFRSHRPLPPFETYRITRYQQTARGEVDRTNSYTRHVFLRTSDSAALTRSYDLNGREGELAFDRPAFNEPRDPGPPTADLLAAADAATNGALAYRADSLEIDGDQLHLRVSAVRDPQHNRVREIFADATTYELRKLIATDTLFIGGSTATYPVTFTVEMSHVDGFPVVSALRGVVGGTYNDDGKRVEYVFSAIAFPPALPDWYFDPKTYHDHRGDAPH
jgi:hypothetical protein